MDKKETVAAEAQDIETVHDEDLVVTFRRPYQFEGEDVESIDLNGLEDITAADLIKAGNYTRRKGVSASMPETTLEFCFYVASQVSGRPLEFFDKLGARDALKVKNTVFSFFYGED